MLRVILMEIEVELWDPEYAIPFFFLYLIYSVFHETFVQKFMKKLSIFSSNFKNSFQAVVYYRKLGCPTLWCWNGALWIEGKKLKNLSVFGAAFSEIKKCWHFEFSWIKYFGNDFSFLIKWHIWVYYCWNYGPSNLKAELKAFWFQIVIYSRKKCPRNGSGQLSPANR